MDPAAQAQFERVVAHFAPGSRLLRTWPLQGGISASMTGLEIRTPGGQTERWVVRRPGAGWLERNPQAAQDEFRLLWRLSSLGLPVPQPLGSDASGKIFPDAYLVLAYVEGQPDFSPADLPGMLAQAAGVLARIHRVNLAHDDLSHLPRQTEGFPELKRPAESDPAFEAGRIRRVLENAHLDPQGNPPVLLHGDFWPGNLVWQAGKLAAVIDWEDAALGEPLLDLAIARLDLAWIFGIEAMDAFTHHYLSEVRMNSASLPYWDLNAALRLARLVGDDLSGWAAFFAPFGRPDVTPESILEKAGLFLARALSRLAE